MEIPTAEGTSRESLTTSQKTPRCQTAVQVMQTKQQQKRTNFKLQAKNILVTSPQNPTELKTIMIRMREFFTRAKKKVKFIVLGREKHKDGNYHVHAVVSMESRVTTRNPHYLDQVFGKHVNMQGCRSVAKSVEYATKDGDYLAWNLNVPRYLQASKSKKSTKMAICEDYLNENKSIMEIQGLMPGFVLQHLSKIRAYKTYAESKRRKVLEDWQQVDIAVTDDDSHRRVIKWLNKNIKKERQFKQKQLYVYGPPNVGKTTLVNVLSKYLHIYHMPTEDFYDSWEDGAYDLVVLDEFKAQKKIQFMNKWLEGSAMPLRVKGSQTLKRENTPMIILSNFSLQQAYGNTDSVRLAPLYARIKEIEVCNYMEFTKTM